MTGKHIITGLSSTALSKEERRLLSELQPLGVIIFKQNIVADNDWQSSLRDLISDVKQAIGREDVIVSVDHEGGLVNRLPEPSVCFPAAFSWGESAHDVGAAMGEQLSAFGINLNFAPVLDVWCEEQNTVIGKRAFAKTPTSIASSARAFLEGMHTHGVLGCGKHFPGHGATIADSHVELPVLDISLEELKAREAIPFKEMVQADIEMIMTAHVLYPQIDSANPATFSSKILKGFLREELGFKGVIISDDLEMKAITKFSVKERAEKCIAAGVDVLLMGNPAEKNPVTRAMQLAEGVLSSGISKEESEASKARINTLLAHSCLQSKSQPTKPDFAKARSLAEKLSHS
jgi:beta-N-acetylhexosaminidase